MWVQVSYPVWQQVLFMFSFCKCFFANLRWCCLNEFSEWLLDKWDFVVFFVFFFVFFYYVPLLWRSWKNIIQLLIVESLDMMWCRWENTSIDQGGAEVSIGILWSTSHHVERLNSQQILCYIITSLNEFQMWCSELLVRKTATCLLSTSPLKFTTV